MKLKIGETLICKKEYIIDVGTNTSTLLTNGKRYIIENVNNNNIYVSCDAAFGGLKKLNPNRFTTLHGVSKISDYFYTKKELRKLKLEKINGKF